MKSLRSCIRIKSLHIKNTVKPQMPNVDSLRIYIETKWISGFAHLHISTPMHEAVHRERRYIVSRHFNDSLAVVM